MVRWHERSQRKKSGGLRKPKRKRKKYEQGAFPAETTVGEERQRVRRGRGGTRKIGLKRTHYANLVDQEKGVTEKVEIQTVAENPANREFVRRNIISKGAIIETEKGTARVTSRPGQDGVVNAIKVAATDTT